MSNGNIDNKIQDIKKRLSKLEKAVFEEGSSSFSQSAKGIEKLIVEKVNDIHTHHLIVISLKLRAKQTRDEIKETLQDWGKVFGKWFTGGNFSNRLIKTNIVKLEGKNDDGEDLFTLTKKGELLAEELIKKIQG